MPLKGINGLSGIDLTALTQVAPSKLSDRIVGLGLNFDENDRLYSEDSNGIKFYQYDASKEDFKEVSEYSASKKKDMEASLCHDQSSLAVLGINNKTEGVDGIKKTQRKSLGEFSKAVYVKPDDDNDFSRLKEENSKLKSENDQLKSENDKLKEKHVQLEVAPTRSSAGSSQEALQRENKQLREQVEELTTRLSRFASKQLVDGNPDMADLSDKNRPTKLGEKIGQIYDDEWSDAHTALETNKGCDEYEAISLLLQTVCDVDNAVHEYIEGKQKEIGKLFPGLPKDDKVIKSMFLEGVKRQNNLEEVKDAIIKKVELPSDDEEVNVYARVLIEVLYRAFSQNPPMVLKHAEKGIPFDKELLSFYGNKGATVETPVWPIVYLHENGPLVSKGYAKPFDPKHVS